MKDKVIARVAQLAEAADSKSACYEFDSRLAYQHYSYLLGQFLGDGNLTQVTFGSGKKGFRMRIYQDVKYPNITKLTKESISYLFENKIQTQNKGSYLEVGFYNTNLDKYFPFLNSGKAFNNDLKLEKWQERVIFEFPEFFVKGCIHSDGCVYKDREYTYYCFSNTNEIIKNYYCECCKLLGFGYTRTVGKKVIFHRKKETVAKMLAVIGLKT